MSARPNSNIPETSSRILVTSVSMSTTEDTLKNFFAFCGEIRAMHLYSAENGTQEAVIKFDGEASASTACLLNNALVDGNHISIKALPAEPKPSASPQGSTSSSQRPTSPKEAFTGFFNSFLAAGKNLADSVVDTAKQIDEKYAVTDTVSHAAQTAWTATVDTATTVDEKLKISETTTKLYHEAKVMTGMETKSGTPQPSSSPKPSAAPEGYAQAPAEPSDESAESQL